MAEVQTVTDGKLPEQLLWLSDAPLFIDDCQIAKLHDAIVRPLYRQGAVRREDVQTTSLTLGVKAGAEGGVETGTLFQLFSFGLFKGSAKVTAEGDVSHEGANQAGQTIELLPIDSAQRQIEQLALYYYAYMPDRIHLVTNPQDEKWRNSEMILKSPRPLALLDLPGQVAADKQGVPHTKLIPTAAEFADGTIQLLYADLKKTTGEDRAGMKLEVENPPSYPERAESVDKLKLERKNYWSWFESNFSATKAMLAVEQAASEHGRIRWIDFRLPVTKEGDTLHLHICPSEKYDTGALAYNLIKRGFKHGLRLVGTLKSEPDMNVLAIYEK